VFTYLDANRMAAARREAHRGLLPEPGRAVLPAPAAVAAVVARLEVHQQGAAGATAIDGRAILINRIGKLHPDRVVPLRVVVRAKPKPDVERRRSVRAERCLEVV